MYWIRSRNYLFLSDVSGTEKEEQWQSEIGALSGKNVSLAGVYG